MANRPPDQKRDLERIGKGCRAVLEDLQRIVEKFQSLGRQQENVGPHWVGISGHFRVEIPIDFEHKSS
jgi:hypothetical protein